MIPRTLSATSLQVWNLCPDRWQAEYLNRGSNFSNKAADTGTAVHGGLEMFVKAAFIDKTHADLTRVQQKELLISFYQMSYVQTFGTADMETAEYKDGFNLTMKWFERTDLSKVMAVLSAEVKHGIPIPFNHPDKNHQPCEFCEGSPYQGVGRCVRPFNYIMDRKDQAGETEYEVVDYKTVRVPIQPDDLGAKVQARAYALAVQIEHPDATRIKVTFDLLRHEKISMFFTREDNINFWHYLCNEFQRIVDTQPEDVSPKLNMECGYCVKKFDCKVMQSNVAVGGIMSLSMDDTVKMKALLEAQTKANKLMIEQLEEQMFMYAAERDILEWETEDGSMTVEVSGNRRRGFDAQAAARIMGPELFTQVGNMTLGNLEKIINDESLDPAMRAELKDLISWNTTGLSAKVKPKKAVF